MPTRHQPCSSSDCRALTSQNVPVLRSTPQEAVHGTRRSWSFRVANSQPKAQVRGSGREKARFCRLSNESLVLCSSLSQQHRRRRESSEQTVHGKAGEESCQG